MYADVMAGFLGETLVYVAGRKGMGKSTFMRACVIALACDGWRFVVWDTTREWTATPRGLPAAQLDALRRNVRVLPSVRHSVEDAAAYAVASAPATLVVDEVDRVAPNHAGGLREGTQLHAIVNYGRHLGVALFAASRRPARVHSEIPSLADKIVLFQLTSPRDLDWVRDATDDETAEDVRQLTRGDYVVWSPSDDNTTGETAGAGPASAATNPAKV